MAREKLPILASAIAAGLFALSGLGVALPALLTGGEVEQETHSLLDEIAAIEARSLSTEALAVELAESRARFSAEHKLVPDKPDVAGLIRQLGGDSHEDEQTQRQTLTTGQVQQEDNIKLLPVILETRGVFPDAFELVHRIEQLDRLTRLRRVTVTRDSSDRQVIRTTIQLDAFFDRTDDSQAQVASP